MSQFPGNGGFYNHDGASPSEPGDSFGWWTSPSTTYVPMARNPSGDSITTSYGSDQVQTPTSDYGAYNNSWGMPLDDYPWPPASDFSHEIPFSPSPTNSNPPYMSEIEYITGNGNDYNTGDQEAYWGYHGYTASAEPGQQTYWRPKPDHKPIDQGPTTGDVEDTAATNDGLYVCKEKGCHGRFRRKADFIRHREQRHLPADKKTKFPCDWKKCQRAKDPFYRRDHQRDHFRDYHSEDLTRRGSSSKEDDKWWKSRMINPIWWRCRHCLARVKVQEHGYICPACVTSCETERQSYRSRKAEQHGPA
ncbi:hypothetical protein GGR51DRAFT_447244 [Nemania sp. FL0031]|nr:hypothetical protein GGR51DRAFT_447244 [Nemania sp. FL0031]